MKKTKPAASSASDEPSLSAPRGSTKIGALLALMRRPGGADVHVLAEAVGWRPHSVRGAIAGQIKKKLGIAVISEKRDGKTVYRVEAGA